MSENYATPTAAAAVPPPPLPLVPSVPPPPVVPTPKVMVKRPNLSGRLVIVALILIVISVSTVAYAVAYEKINIGNPALEREVTRFVLDLPFTPKTARYLLTKAVLAQKSVSKHSLDISLASNSPAFAPFLGSLTSLDGNLKGAVDYADPKNPKFSLNLALTKDFNVDLRKDGRFIFFRINKIPLPLLTYFPGSGALANLDTVLPNWVAYDATPLTTDARTLLDQANTGTSLTNTFVEKTIDNFLDEKILKAITVSKESKDGVAMYKLALKADAALVDYLYNKVNGISDAKTSNLSYKFKLSDSLKDFEVNLWIGQKDYYIHELSSAFKLITPSSGGSSLGMLSGLTGGQAEELPVAVVIKLADFGKAVSVETPASYLTPEKYLELLTANSPTLKTAQDQAKDAKRKADINILRTALELCYTESADSKYAVKLEDLIKCNVIRTVPTDPDTRENYNYQPSATRTGFTLKASLSTGKTYEATENGVGEK